MSVFICSNGTHICLVKSEEYQLFEKSLKKGEDSVECAYLLRNPRIVITKKRGVVQKRKTDLVRFETDLKIVDFSNFPDHEGSKTLNCPSGVYRMDWLTVITENGWLADLVVIAGTHVGLAVQGLETVLNRQKWQKDCLIRRELVKQMITNRFGLTAEELQDDFQLPDIQDWGVPIGIGLYRSLQIFKDKKPVLLRVGMTVRQVLEQLDC